MKDKTCETVVGLGLVRHLQTINGTTILSFHPPSAKAYQTEIIRIPKLTERGQRSRERYHIDLIFVVRRTLWFVELKCRLSESQDDIVKLNQLMKEYSQEDLLGFIASRLTSAPSTVLSEVKKVYLGLGVEVVDAAIPTGFTVFQIKGDEVRLFTEMNYRLGSE